MFSVIAVSLILQGILGQGFNSSGPRSQAYSDISSTGLTIFTPSILTVIDGSVLTFHGAAASQIYVWPCDPDGSSPPSCGFEVMDFNNGEIEYVVQGAGTLWFTISNHRNNTCLGHDSLQISILSIENQSWCASQSLAPTASSNWTWTSSQPTQMSDGSITSNFNVSSALASLSSNGQIGPRPTNVTGITSTSRGRKTHCHLQYSLLIPVLLPLFF